MSAQIILFPSARIRRMTYPGIVPSDMMLISISTAIPYVEYNLSLNLLYDVMAGAKPKPRAKKTTKPK